jgi:non-ribosomal peptide synthetase component E (peptide arylation enzyme)
MTDEYEAQGYWGRETLADICDRHAREHPHREAFADSKARLTWSELRQLSDRAARGLLELDIKKDEVVVVQLPNWVENIILRIALLKAGILSLFPPMTWRHAEMEFALKSLDGVGVVIPYRFRRVDHFQMIQDIRPRLPSLRHIFVVGDEVPPGAISFAELCQQPEGGGDPADYLRNTQFDPFEVTNIMPTSGTTGVPKFCEHSQVAHQLIARTLVERAKITREDVVGAIAPLSGGAAIFGFICPMLVAGRGALLDWFDAEEALKLIERERVTVAIVVPAQLIGMLRHPNLDKYDLSSLRVVRAGGAATPPNIAAEVEQKMGCKFLPGAGSMDALAISQASVDDPPEVRYATAGRPSIGNQVRLVDEEGKEVGRGEVGEIRVRGACTASGYYRDVQATKEAWGELGEGGWWRSGDLARFDDRGNIIFAGRRKDVIIRGAQNIYPMEIENLLFTHPKVSQVAIVGMPDPLMGERACAYVVPKPGQEFSFDEMVSFLRGKNIAPYKLPERLEIVDRMPAAGDVAKVDKKELARDIAQKLKAEGKV